MEYGQAIGEASAVTARSPARRRHGARPRGGPGRDADAAGVRARLVPGVDVDGAEDQAAHATFGPLLTVLSSGPVELPTVTVDGRPVRIESVAAQSWDGR
jgi:hypothetical protein